MLYVALRYRCWLSRATVIYTFRVDGGSTEAEERGGVGGGGGRLIISLRAQHASVWFIQIPRTHTAGNNVANSHQFILRNLYDVSIHRMYTRGGFVNHSV